MSAESVADAFVQHYYQTRDSNVQSLGGLFVSRGRGGTNATTSLSVHNAIYLTHPTFRCRHSFAVLDYYLICRTYCNYSNQAR